jgi:hypothetical protein
MWAYRSSGIATIPGRFTGHHVTAVRQLPWDAADPHPTDLPILNDAGAVACPRELIEDRMAREQILMANLLTGETFGAASDPAAASSGHLPG